MRMPSAMLRSPIVRYWRRRNAWAPVPYDRTPEHRAGNRAHLGGAGVLAEDVASQTPGYDQGEDREPQDESYEHRELWLLEARLGGGLVTESHGDRDDVRYHPPVPGVGRVEDIRHHALLELPAVGCVGDRRVHLDPSDAPIRPHPERDADPATGHDAGSVTRRLEQLPRGGAENVTTRVARSRPPPPPSSGSPPPPSAPHSAAIRRRVARSARRTVGVTAMSTAPGVPPGRTKKLSPSDAGRAPPADARSARPPATSSATIAVCPSRASVALGASGRARSGSPSGGGSGPRRSPSGGGRRVTGIHTPRTTRGARANSRPSPFQAPLAPTLGPPTSPAPLA